MSSCLDAYSGAHCQAPVPSLTPAMVSVTATASVAREARGLEYWVGTRIIAVWAMDGNSQCKSGIVWCGVDIAGEVL